MKYKMGDKVKIPKNNLKCDTFEIIYVTIETRYLVMAMHGPFKGMNFFCVEEDVADTIKSVGFIIE